jgi:CxxC motif-containing protein
VSETSHYLCIGCPLGCRLEVDADGPDVVEVRGFACSRGDRFARQEHVAPRRHLTTTVRVRGGTWSRLPVKTAASIPKARLLDLARALHELDLEAPVRLGEVVLADALGLGVDVVATRDMPRGAPAAGQLPTSSMP